MYCDSDDDDDEALIFDDSYDHQLSDSEIIVMPSETPTKAPLKAVVFKETSSSPDFESTKKIAFLLSDLQTAIIKDDCKLVSKIISDHVSLVNTFLETGWPPLIYASRFGRSEIVSLLLEADADPNIKENSDGSTPAMAACSCQDTDEVIKILKILVKYKADLSITDRDGKSVLIYATKAGNLELVEFVLSITPELVNTSSLRGWTALDWAINNQEVQLVKLLVSYGASKLGAYDEKLLAEEMKEFLQSKNLLVDTSKVEEDKDLICESGEKLPENSEKEKIVIVLSDNQSNELSLKDTEEQNKGDVVTVINHPSVCKDVYVPSYGRLELFLLGINLVDIIPLFHEHNVTFEQLLHMTMDDLVTIGVKQLGSRKLILQTVKKWHAIEWTEESIPEFQDIHLKFNDVQSILKNCTEHIAYIGGSLRYVVHNLNENPKIFVPPANECYDQDPYLLCTQQVQNLKNVVYGMCCSLKSLHNRLETLKIEADMKQADNISLTKPSYSTTTTIISGLMIGVAITGPVAFLLRTCFKIERLFK